MSDIENTPEVSIADGGIQTEHLNADDVDWKSTAEALQAELSARKVYPHVDGDFLILGPEIFTKVDDQSAIMYKGVAYGVRKGRETQPKDLKAYSVKEHVEVQKFGNWVPGIITSKQPGVLNVDTEVGPVSVGSYHIIRKASSDGEE